MQMLKMTLPGCSVLLQTWVLSHRLLSHSVPPTTARKETSLRPLTKLRENNSQTFLAPVSRILNMHFDKDFYFQVSLVLRKMTVKIYI